MTTNDSKRKVLLSLLGALMKQHGFAKKGFTFCRETEKGLIQVVELRLGPAWSGKAGEINLEFGIFSEEWNAFLNQTKVPSALRTADCELRDCYCNRISKTDSNNWFQLTETPEQLAQEITCELESQILPYLDTLKTRIDILESYRMHGEGIGLPPRHAISVGILILGTGDTATGLRLVTEVCQANPANPFYQKVLELVTNAYAS